MANPSVVLCRAKVPQGVRAPWEQSTAGQKTPNQPGGAACRSSHSSRWAHRVKAGMLPRRGRARGSIRRRGARTLRGPGGRRGGTGRREPGWISRFHPDSPSALPADSVLFGDHVTRAAFDPGLGAGRGRGPRPEGCQARDPRGRCAAARVPEAMTPSKQSPGEANKLFGVREGPALGVGEAAEGRRGGQRLALAATYGQESLAGPQGCGFCPACG